MATSSGRRKNVFWNAARLVNRFTFGYFVNSHFVRLRDYPDYFRDLKRYKKMPGGGGISVGDLEPALGEKTATTKIDYDYFYQDTWCAGKVFENKPKQHVDVGSTVLLVGVLSKWVPVVSVDIRPLDVKLSGLETRIGSATDMPFEDNSVESLSSICVIEHIGLGRYGDPLDPYGTDKTIQEFERVLAPGGNMYISVPIGREDKVRFNALRVFQAEAFPARFKQCSVVETGYVQGNALYAADEFDKVDFNRAAIGLFHFVKQ